MVVSTAMVGAVEKMWYEPRHGLGGHVEFHLRHVRLCLLLARWFSSPAGCHETYQPEALWSHCLVHMLDNRRGDDSAQDLLMRGQQELISLPHQSRGTQAASAFPDQLLKHSKFHCTIFTDLGRRVALTALQTLTLRCSGELLTQLLPIATHSQSFAATSCGKSTSYPRLQKLCPSADMASYESKPPLIILSERYLH